VDMLLAAFAWVTVGAIVGVMGTRAFYRRTVITAGRMSRAPVCNSCPFVSPEQRAEILTGRPTEAPPPMVGLPMVDGSNLHRSV
jgi:hypothetical protein